MPEFNLADMDRFFGSQPDGIVGKRTRPSARQSKSDAPTLKEWVAQMDESNGWPEFEKRVQDFSNQFEIPYAKAVIYILFNVF